MRAKTHGCTGPQSEPGIPGSISFGPVGACRQFMSSPSSAALTRSYRPPLPNKRWPGPRESLQHGRDLAVRQGSEHRNQPTNCAGTPDGSPNIGVPLPCLIAGKTSGPRWRSRLRRSRRIFDNQHASASVGSYREAQTLDAGGRPTARDCAAAGDYSGIDSFARPVGAVRGVTERERRTPVGRAGPFASSTSLIICADTIGLAPHRREDP